MSGLCVLCLLTALQAITTNRVKSIDTTKKHALTQQQHNSNTIIIIIIIVDKLLLLCYTNNTKREERKRKKGKVEGMMNRIVEIIIAIAVVVGLYFLMVGCDKITVDRAIEEVDALGNVRIVEGYTQQCDDGQQVVIVPTEGQEYTITNSEANGNVECWIADNNTPTDYTDDTVVEVIEQDL